MIFPSEGSSRISVSGIPRRSDRYFSAASLMKARSSRRARSAPIWRASCRRKRRSAPPVTDLLREPRARTPRSRRPTQSGRTTRFTSPSVRTRRATSPRLPGETTRILPGRTPDNRKGSSGGSPARTGEVTAATGGERALPGASDAWTNTKPDPVPFRMASTRCRSRRESGIPSHRSPPTASRVRSLISAVKRSFRPPVFFPGRVFRIAITLPSDEAPEKPAARPARCVYR